MATAGTYNFVMDQGATFTLQMVYQNGAGVPINLTGYTAKMQLRLKFGSPDAALTLSTENGGLTIDGPTGTISILATDEQTLALDPALYVYDLDIISGGTIERLVMGQVTVRAEVTVNA